MRQKMTPKLSSPRRYEQSIMIAASATAVEQCLCELELMHRWLNPALRCFPVGAWGTQVGDRSRFVVQLPLLPQRWHPTLENVVIERAPGLIVWAFTGFFVGRDRWECVPLGTAGEGAQSSVPTGVPIKGVQTKLVNCFEFTIPQAIVAWGFDWLAADAVRADMQAQLRRLKVVAEALYLSSI